MSDALLAWESTLSHLECSRTGERYDSESLQGLSKVGAPLLARYDLDRAAQIISPSLLKESAKPGLWRYAPLLPVRAASTVRFLGEGWTPLLKSPRLSEKVGISDLWIKEEGPNPTGSFKARGMAVAIAKAFELGAREFAVGTAGNAGSALAAYAAAYEAEAHIAMPRDTPRINALECEAFGADLTLVDGLITDANAHVQKGVRDHGWFDVATLREPYRIEGKKTMGYELFEQFGGSLPNVILYPTGGGTGLIGMWKAFDEMEKLGWIGQERPRMVCVQAAGCVPIVEAFAKDWDTAQPWTDAHTIASGLRVPRAIGDFLILKALRESKGTAIAVTDDEISEAWREFAMCSGIFPAPEGAATYAALKSLKEAGWIHPNERVVLFDTGVGIKYEEAWTGKIG